MPILLTNWVSYLLTNKGAHLYNGNGPTMKCLKCKNTFVSEDNFTNHNCLSIMYNSSFIATLVGTTGMYIPDDVITASINLLRVYDVNNIFSIGQFTPAAQQAAMFDQAHRPCLDDDNLAINFLLINAHWVTVIYDPQSRTVHLLDSLRNSNRPLQVLPILKKMYTNISEDDIVYPVVAQQPDHDPSCGAYAVAFAVSYILGKPPSDEVYVQSQMRTHLKHCLLNKVVLPFPTNNTTELG